MEQHIELKKNKDGYTSKAASKMSENNKFLEKLQNLERFLQKKDAESGAKYHENIINCQQNQGTL